MTTKTKTTIFFGLLALTFIAIAWFGAQVYINEHTHTKGVWKVGDAVRTMSCYQTGTITSITASESGYIVTIGGNGDCVAFTDELEPLNPPTLTSVPK